MVFNKVREGAKEMKIKSSGASTLSRATLASGDGYLDERYQVFTFLHYAVMLQGLCLHLQQRFIFVCVCVCLWKPHNRKRKKKRGNTGLSPELSLQINKRNKSENYSSRLSACKIT